MISIALLKVDEIMSSEQPIYEVSDDEKKMLKKSIEEIGLIYPLVVTKDGDKYKILDGRTRFQILKQLKREIIPCIIVKDEDEWLKKRFRIPYEVELFRRHLKYNERKRYKQLLEERLADPNFISKIISDFFTPKIVAKIREVVLNKFPSSVVNKILVSIKDLSEEEQMQILENIGTIIPPGALQEIEMLRGVIKTLESEKAKLKVELAKQEKERERFFEKLRNKVNEELERKKKELEAQYKGKKEELDEDDLRRIIEEERKRIYAAYKEEIEEFDKKLNILTKNIKAKEEENKNLKDRLKSLEEQCKCAFEEAERYREDREYFARILESMTGVDKLKKELSGILEELQSIKKLLIDLGEDYTMEIPKEGIDEVMAMLKDISKTAKEVEGLFREYS